jgi:hypothetical protein
MGLISRAKEVYQENGVIPLIQSTTSYLYTEYFRNYSPRMNKKIRYNNVVTGDVRLFDYVFKYGSASGNPVHKLPNINALVTAISDGDEVLVLGGGMGVTAVHAAWCGGDVTVFEASARVCERLERVIELNGVADRVTVRNALVGSDVRLAAGEVPQTVDPATLDGFDVVEIDIQGAEISVLNQLAARPRRIIVETHGYLGASPDKSAEQLRNMGYDVERRLSEEGKRESERMGMYILVGSQ